PADGPAARRYRGAGAGRAVRPRARSRAPSDGGSGSACPADRAAGHCKHGRLAQSSCCARRGADLSNVKLVWFVPEEALDQTREAVFAAGAGRIGEYERCSWYAFGTGTFFGSASTEPTVGERGREERVRELRVETVVPTDRLGAVVAALR